jgi:hypothetical protein
MATDLRHQAESEQEFHPTWAPLMVTASGMTFDNHRRDYSKPRHLSHATSPKTFSTPLPRHDPTREKTNKQTLFSAKLGKCPILRDSK